MAGDLLMSVSKDERERAIFRSRRMYQSDLDSNIATVEHRVKFAIVGNAMGMGMDFDTITRLTGLTRKEVESLSEQQG